MLRKSVIILMAFLYSNLSYANWFADIVDRIEKTNAINSNILDSQMASLNVQQDIFSSQKNIEVLTKQVHDAMIGSFGWGAYNVHDYQSYGSGANDWSSVMQMANGSYGSGALGQTMNSLANQFPIDKNAFNQSANNHTSQQYYALKAQTVLATRAASQLDYDKIQDQIAYQQMLQQQIEKAKDLKSAIDLSNRIQVEGNLITLEILRQSALSNQQQAITEQAGINGALSNAKFLTK